MLLAMMASIVGIVFVMVPRAWEDHFQSIHSILGMVVFVLLLGQFILGMVVDKMFQSNRDTIPLRDKLHWGLGIALCVLSIVTMLLGHLLYNTSKGLLILHALVLLAWIVGFGLAQKMIGQTHELPHEKDSSRADLNPNA
jgi:hypothetical protein